MTTIRVGVVGCGAISSVYLDTMTRHFPDVLEVRLCSSAHMYSAQVRAAQYGITAVSTEALLASPDIDLVVNLTPVPAHEAIIRQALEPGEARLLGEDADRISEAVCTDACTGGKAGPVVVLRTGYHAQRWCTDGASGTAGWHDRKGDQRRDEYEP